MNTKGGAQINLLENIEIITHLFPHFIVSILTAAMNAEIPVTLRQSDVVRLSEPVPRRFIVGSAKIAMIPNCRSEVTVDFSADEVLQMIEGACAQPICGPTSAK